MADEIRVTTVSGTEVHSVAGGPAGSEGPVVIDAKEEIQATRSRISDTIDEIEGKILEKKERIEERLDVLAPVRERPLRVLGAVFGAGLALGLLTGGGHDEDEEARHEDDGGEDDRREELAKLWEGRARRLLRIAREQEEEIEELRARLGRRSAGAALVEEGEEDEGDSTMDRLRGYLAEHLSGLATEAVQQLLRRVARG
jgi:ElaB/YqjD/DUF883 family membrane-anchored ribosome-binding protein